MRLTKEVFQSVSVPKAAGRVILDERLRGLPLEAMRSGEEGFVNRLILSAYLQGLVDGQALKERAQ